MDQTEFQKETQELILPILKQLGFSEKEQIIYFAMLTVGKADASQLIQYTKLKRGITYNILYKLEQLGVIESTQEEGKQVFTLRPPSILLALAEKKKLESESTITMLEQNMSTLQGQYKHIIGKPTIQYFEGTQGLKDVFKDIYGPKKDSVYGCVDLEQAAEVFKNYVIDELVPTRVKNNLMAYTFFADSEQARLLHEKDTQQLRDSLLVDKELYPLPAEIDVYEDKIAMLSFEKGEFVGLLIENAQFATTLKTIFKLAFENTKRIKQK